MINITQIENKYNKVQMDWVTVCKYCKKEIRFLSIFPVYCPLCYQEQLPLHEFLYKNCKARVDYHFKGDL
jgi:hypothetical protein